MSDPKDFIEKFEWTITDGGLDRDYIPDDFNGIMRVIIYHLRNSAKNLGFSIGILIMLYVVWRLSHNTKIERQYTNHYNIFSLDFQTHLSKDDLIIQSSHRRRIRKNYLRIHKDLRRDPIKLPDNQFLRNIPLYPKLYFWRSW